MQSTTLNISGLFTSPNSLSAVPPGALVKANNVVINRASTAESRRGFALFGDITDPVTNAVVNQLLNYKGCVLRQYGNSLDIDSEKNGTFTKLTNYDGIAANVSPSVIGKRIAGLEVNGNYYFTSSQGVRKLSVLDSSGFAQASISPSGGIAALDLRLSINPTQGFFTPSSVAGYRVVWGYKDANTNLILGSPSEREVINNPDTTIAKTVDLIITIPTGVTPAYFCQVYRSPVLSNANTVTTSGKLYGNTTIDTIPDTSTLAIGNAISGSGIPAKTTIVAINSTTSITISAAATQGSDTAPISVTTLIIEQILNQDPGDELQLVYEINPTATQIATGVMYLQDRTPETYRESGAYLYTNQNSAEGILQENAIPPYCTDIALFKGYTFYSNTSSNQNLTTTLISISNLVSGTSSLSITDGTKVETYTFNDLTSTGSISLATDAYTIVNIPDTSLIPIGASITGTNESNSAIIAVDSYVVSVLQSVPATLTTAAIPGSITLSSALGSPTTSEVSFTVSIESAENRMAGISQYATTAQQIDDTARSLVHIINRQQNGMVYATYLSGINDIPGKILLTARTVSNTPFYLITDSLKTGAQFNDAITDLVATATPAVVSTNDITPNRIYYSKFQQPEAVPLLNYVDVGSKDKAILRIVALKDAIVILKEDGVYRLYGNVAPFTLTLVNQSTHLKAPDSVSVLNNIIYCYTSQGISAITETTSQVISTPIENDIMNLLTNSYANFSSATFGIGYESDRSYYLFTVKNLTDAVATQCFRYNTFTSSWTTLDLSKTCGMVNSYDDTLYLGASDVPYIEKERKSFDRTDYADREYNLSVLSASATTEVRLSSTAKTEVGDVLVQVTASGAILESPISAVNSLYNTVTLPIVSPFVVGNVTLYKAILTEVQWAPNTLTDVSMTKQVSDGTLIFKDTSFTNGVLSYSSDLSANFDSQTVSGLGTGVFGNTTFGNGLFGGYGSSIPLRTYIPRDKGRCRLMNVAFSHQVARESAVLLGTSLSYNMVSNRGWR